MRFCRPADQQDRLQAQGQGLQEAQEERWKAHGPPPSIRQGDLVALHLKRLFLC